MDTSSLDQKIINRGKDFFASIKGEAPSLFNKSWWMGRVMGWAMNNERFKIQLFRFVDVLPYLGTRESLARHIEEYFATGDPDIPKAMRWGAGKAGIIGRITGGIMQRTIRSNLESMARQFIIGETVKEALKTIKKIRRDGFTCTVDILGEATVSEKEAAASMDMYLQLLAALQENSRKWAAVGGTDLDWGHAPLVNVSVKPSALFARIDPVDFEGSVQGIIRRLAVIYRKVIEMGGFLHIDMEHHLFKDITLEVYRRLRASAEFRHYPHFGVVLQSYLRETDADLQHLLAWAGENELPIAIRLVKGAYWDYETVTAGQNGREIPVYTCKAESDAAFERHSRLILENHALCYFACGSHNIRSISAVMEIAREVHVPESRYEFQVLYGMAEPVRKGLLQVAGRVRLYAPYGALLPGMAYLVRRLLENTANESFLRQSFVEEREVERLLENPLTTVERAFLEGTGTFKTARSDRFRNEPLADFSSAGARESFKDAIAQVRQELGQVYPLLIGGRDISTEDLLASVNPAAPDEIIGQVCQASATEIDLAARAARSALPAWAALSATERAGYLFRAAGLARKKLFTLAAWQVLEVGKQWGQAQADVAEAIDFLEYYGREAIRLGSARRMGAAPGELNHLVYRPKGIAAVIAPWNFPLAISCGMSSAALVAGNPVLYKPAGPSSVVGHTLARLFQEAGLPDGVFNYVPGRGSEMGDALTTHPDVAVIAFTGSVEVGCHIARTAADVQPGWHQIKRVIAEMGGKNAIIIDDDADLDEAVRQVITSAFAFQGQKCSACSRLIVVAPIYDRLIERLIQAADSLTIGPAEDPACFMGPVIDEKARDRIMEYVQLARKEGRVLLCRDEVPEKGFYVPLTIVEGITPEHRLAQEEIFGPVLAVMKVKDIDQALQWADSTRFGLTGALFSRSPSHLEKARKAFNVGNLYLNRGCTGALVERQPFGGFKMSGIGSKAGGPDYLLQFMDPQVITENTMRRGFAPAEAEEDGEEARSMQRAAAHGGQQ